MANDHGFRVERRRPHSSVDALALLETNELELGIMVIRKRKVISSIQNWPFWLKSKTGRNRILRRRVQKFAPFGAEVLEVLLQ